VPDRAPIETIEASGQWKDGRVRIDWEWPRPDGKLRRGFWDFTAKKVISKPGESDKWPPSLDPGKGYCGPAGKWRVQGGELVQEDVTADVKIAPWINFGDRSWVEYDLRMKAMKIRGDNGFIVAFDIIWGSKKLTQWCIGLNGNRDSYVETCENLPDRVQCTPRTEIRPLTIKDNHWYDIHIKARGKRIECFLDGR
jgi:hypothetical protein